jgi:hypothetical protein
MVALPCLLAAACLGVWLTALMRAESRPLLARSVALAVCVANPITVVALETGHPEELLGGCLCVAAVLVASASVVSRRRALVTGLLLGLAVANKQWALLALGPVLLALPPGRRLSALAMAGAVTAALLAPLALSSASHFASGTGVLAAPGSAIFQPWQLWWFFGHHGALVHGLFGVAKPGYRIAPAWAAQISHPAILAAGALIVAGLWARSHGRRLGAPEALLALALALLGRCLLDTWDAAYYPLPLILALLAWEARGESRQPPVLALAVSALVWVSFKYLPRHISPDLQAGAFLAWSLPLAAFLGWRLLRAQETTVSSLGRRVRTSHPSARTTTRSSIRTPSVSGR